MANQAIALQARAPQTDFMGRAIQQNAQVINMMAQQRAAERQAAQLQQEMDIEAAKEARGVQTHTAEMRAKDQSYRDAELKQLRNIGVSVLRSGSEPAYQAWVGEIEKVDPRFAATIRQISPSFNPDVMKYIISEADAYLQKNTSQRVAKEVFDEQGNLIVMDIGGDTPSRIEPGIITNIPNPQGSPPMGGSTSPAAPAAEMAAPMGGGAVDNRSLSQVVSSALETGVMAKADYDKILSIAQPESRAKIAAWVQSNNIEVMDEPSEMRVSPMSYDGQTPQAEFAVLRGEPMQSRTASLRDAPPMEQTLAQYQVGQQVRGRNPNMPQSANVPIERVRQEAVAGRESAQEVYAKELARARAARVAAQEAGPKPLTQIQEQKLRENISKDYKSARSTVEMMLDPKTGVVGAVDAVRRLSPSQKEAITGYSGYLPSITPSSRSADTVMKNLRGKVTEMGKSAASLTGAIGQMAIQEWRIVSDMIASLDIEGMEPADLDNQLDIIETQARRAAEITRDAYENQYAEEFQRYPGRFQLPSSTAAAPKQRANERNLPRIRTDAQWRALKPGTLYIAPNGETKRKR